MFCCQGHKIRSHLGYYAGISQLLWLFRNCGCCHRQLYRPKRVNCRLYWSIVGLSCVGSFEVPCVGKTSFLSFTHIFQSLNLAPFYLCHVLSWGRRAFCLRSVLWSFVCLEGGRPVGCWLPPAGPLTGKVTSWVLLQFYSRACIFGLYGLTHN